MTGIVFCPTVGRAGRKGGVSARSVSLIMAEPDSLPGDLFLTPMGQVLAELNHGGAVTLGQFLGGVLRLGGLLGGVLILQVEELNLPGLSLSEKLFFLRLVTWTTLGGDGVLESGDSVGDLGLPLLFLFG